MKTKKPVIGLVPLVDEARDSYWMLPGYMKGVELAGGIPVMLPLTDDDASIEKIAEMMDGFIFTGGHDVDPGIYGEAMKSECTALCPERDAMEKKLLPLAIEKNKSVLGICRGLQFINSVLGGTLYQDLDAYHPSEICHRQKPPYDVPAHEVAVVKDSPLHGLLGMETLGVNSCHHQAICVLAPCLEAMAVSPDGLVEAFYMPGKKFVWALQWHPEFMYKVSSESRSVFKAFVDSALE